MAQDESTFNSAAYLAQYPDVARALGQPNVESAWAHYQNYGQNEGRQASFIEPTPEPVFNEAAYLAANPDVAAAIGQPNVSSGLEHYLNYGKNEGRQASFIGQPTDDNVASLYRTILGREPESQAVINAWKAGFGETFDDQDISNFSQAASAELAASGKSFDTNQLVNNAKTAMLPKVDYKQLASDLENQIYAAYGNNYNYDDLYYQLQDIKSKDPAAYYENQLKFLGQQVGWQIGQNRNDRNAPVYDQINALIPEAQAAGLSSDKINSLVGTSINEANAANQQRIVNSQASGGNFWTENLIGAAKVGALALGAYGLDTALAAGGAFTPAVGSGASFSTVPGATYGVGTAAAESALTVPEILASTGFTPTTGSSFAIDPLATYGVGSAAQSLPYTETPYSPFESTNLKGLTAAKIPPISPELALEGTVLPGAAPSTYGSIIAPSLAEGLGVGSGGVLGGGALSAETIANIEAMNAGTGWGLNASQVPNLAAGLELGAIPTSSLSSLLSNAGNLVKGASLAKGLLGAGKNPLQAQAVGAPQAQGRQYAGVDYSPILNLLSIQQPQRSKTSLLG